MAYDTNGNPTAPSDPMKYATTNPAAQTVTINLGGFFFNVFTPGPTSDTVVAHNMGTGLDTTNFDAFVLLHELGHLNGVLGDDNKDPALADAFNAKILNDCFGVSNWQP